MAAYYNEFDPYAAQWLRNLIQAGWIAPGDVDERSIEDVKPSDLLGYTQVHFFAGIGVWSYALRRAGWPDDRPVWTGSCPCQPFSSAGKGDGFADERHLWPAFHYLIEQRKPPVVFGEQVASKDGLGWLDLVQADLEKSAYSSAAVDLCAAGVGAPHIRQRLFFVAERLGYTQHTGLEGFRWYGDGRDQSGRVGAEPAGSAGPAGAAGRLANADDTQRRADGPSGHDSHRGNAEREEAAGHAQDGSAPGGLDHAFSVGRGAGRHDDAEHVGIILDAAGTACRDRTERLANTQLDDSGCQAEPADHAAQEAYGPADRTGGCGSASDEGAGPTNGFWRTADWLGCTDDKWRPVRPGSFPLADGVAGRVGRLRAYGNCIAAPAAQAFIESYMGLK